MSPLRLPLNTAFACALALLVAACDFAGIQSDLEDATTVRLTVPAPPAEFAVTVIDATTQRPVNGEVSLTIAGDDAALIVDPLFYDPIEAVTTASGTIALALPDGTEVSADAPVRFDVIVRADGYITTGRSISIRSTGADVFEVRMLPLSGEAPEGVSVAADADAGSTTNQGTLREPVTITTPTDNQTQARATVTIPEGVTITDAQGRALRGDLTATVAYYSPQSPEAMALFPGGFDDLAVTRADGSTARGGALQTVGFVSIDIFDEAGRRAEQFSAPLDVTMDVPAGMINPETGAPVAAGDQIPVWTYDEITGRWTEEGSFTAPGGGFIVGEPTQDGLIPLAFSVDHLSNKAGGWYDTAAAACTDGAELVLTNRNDLPVRAVITVPGYSFNRTIHMLSDTLRLDGFPSNIPSANVAFFFEDGSLGSIAVDNPCGARVEAELTNVPSDRVTAEFLSNVVCSSQNVTTLPSILIQANRVGVTQPSYLRVENGELTVSGVMMGAEYEVAVDYKTQNDTYQRYEHSFVAEGEVDANGHVRIVQDFIDIQEVCARL
ncbi:MAG: hypothetical protein AAF624_05060 [Bacteroidota bacterium]